MSRELLTWERDFQTVHAGSFEHGDNAWFLEGRLNASYNCVDRHAFKNPDKPALIYEADDAGDGRIISYGELLRQVSKVAYTLKEMGVKKGRAARPDLKLGICGEHGGDPASIHFFDKVGLDYVSCSPYRVPVARLAAAQAALQVKVGD